MIDTKTVKIGTTTLKNIKRLEVVLNDLDKDTTRNALAGLIRNRVAQVPEIRLVFAPQSKSDMEELLTLLKPVIFPVTFYLPHTQEEKTANFYASPHSPSILKTSPNIVYDEMSVSLIGYNGI